MYGSLFPFRIRSTVPLGVGELLEALTFKPTTRGDVVANLLLYLPLGLCLMSAWSGAPARWRALARTILVGTALAVAVEVTQAHLRFRVSSLTDVALNTVSTLGGASLALAYHALGTSRIAAFTARRLDPAALGIVVLWLAFRLAPFVPTIDWQKYKDALKPLFVDPQLVPADLLRYATGWLVVAYAVRSVTRREHALAVTLALAGAVLFGRLVVVGKSLDITELAALIACVPLATFLIALRSRSRVAALAALLTAAIVVQGLAPFEWLPEARGFSWMPFRSSLRGSVELNFAALLEKCFWYFSLVWLLARGGWSTAAAAFATASVAAAIETAQMWLPGRSADITDPLLVLAVGLLLALSRSTVGSPAGRRVSAAADSRRAPDPPRGIEERL